MSTSYLAKRPPTYTSSALLTLDRTAIELVGGKFETFEYKVDTEVELLRSLALLQRVYERVNSVETRTATAIQRGERASSSDVRSQLANLCTKAAESSRSVDPLAFQKYFKISRRGLTDVISVEAKADTPECAAELANTYVDIYLEEQASAKREVASRVEVVLEDQVQSLKSELAGPGGQMEVRQKLKEATDQLDKLKRSANLLVPDLRIAARALPIPNVAFPSPKLTIALVWLALIGAAVLAFLLLKRIRSAKLILRG